ncbi:energy-coupling factor ABC transporter substrate-binding protein [Limosilactobacillus balticus]|uniref:Cobalt transport protein CbiN n=1 Tax=Limosilactobacillus balticus TaxID=2759747 RepID=A0ABS8RBK8_9LACO|nr:energy-coupling factor ABC transporter substrate-binding protein [Limosilactobacillus balticus]MBB1110522.1 energy-coupling factor ABC transporter substrate-binding protein [Limosilactobacillus balticus]MBB1127993.1 energy-coupling factor ABC transporter substrate-binding protein [Limosilactobacillus balticus]MCD7136915.1 energy-coupling factor ABC transporter substrate-binding protein [Limosilactobacillus balticus]MCD7138413.1 energy-coupling factor ABC transporter substrate-binding protein
MKKRTKTNIILLICVILLILIPFIFVKGEYGGSDDQGTEQIKKFDPHYKVWAQPIWTPPSGEIESLLFTVQGSLGTGVICYFIGVAHGKKKARENSKNDGKQQVTGK